MDLLKITPDKEKAKSIMKMVEITEKMISTIDVNSFPSNILKEYYDVIRELISILMLLNGYKAYGEGAHKTQIEYLEKNYKGFTKYETGFLDELRIFRNRISYDGFFIEKEYILKKSGDIKKIISKLKEQINLQLSINP